MLCPVSAGGTESDEVLTFSHFLPKPELFPGYEHLGRVMGCQELEVPTPLACTTATLSCSGLYSKFTPDRWYV